MTGLAKEFGFIVAPCFNGSPGMLRNRATTGTPEMCFFGLAFGQELADQRQDNYTHDYNPDNEFR
jgi:hypothetical protein